MARTRIKLISGYEEAQEIINNCPDEYVAFIAPMLPVFDY